MRCDDFANRRCLERTAAGQKLIRQDTESDAVDEVTTPWFRRVAASSGGAVRQVRPAGPYVLGGIGAGGVVA